MRSATDGAPSFVHLPDLAARAVAGGELVVDGDEAHYLRRVVRVRAGERVTASDGAGTLAGLVVIEAAGEVRAEVHEVRRVERACALELWCGAPEGDRADWLVEKLGELGVATLRLVDTERGAWEQASRRAERWERLAVAALRQSRAAWKLRITPPERLEHALTAGRLAGPALLADPDGGRFPATAGAFAAGVAGAVGPSGGFSDAERKRLETGGFVPTRLGASRLRTETAAVALAALVASASG